MKTFSTEHFYRAQLGQGVGTFHPTSLLPERARAGSCWHQWQTPSDSNWHQDMGLGAHLFSEQLVEGLGNIHFWWSQQGWAQCTSASPSCSIATAELQRNPTVSLSSRHLDLPGYSNTMQLQLAAQYIWNRFMFQLNIYGKALFSPYFFKSSLCSCYFPVIQW